MNKYRLMLCVLPWVMLAGCSSGEETAAPAPATPSENHVFSEQTRALEKAHEAERLLQDTAERQRAIIDETSR